MKTPKHCDEAQLQLLLFGDESSHEFRMQARHVDSCVTCQQRLHHLAAEPQQWEEVSKSLQGNEVSVRDTRALASGSTLLPPPRHPELAGRLGRYDIERWIGQGGMGVVWRGFDTELNRPVAIKVLAPHLAHHGAARSRFAREARAAAAIVHEHVVAIHNVETDGDIPFLVMQFVAGESVQARVDREGPLEIKEVLRIGVQAAAGLASAHEQGVIHRDVKPANILLERGVDRALLTDFGLARTVDDASLTTTGCVTGTPHYMSPEQANGESSDQRTDLFSLGAVLYFMAAGRPPFRAEKALGVLHRICREPHTSLWQMGLQIPDEFSDLVDRLLEKKPARRPSSARRVESRLKHLLAGLQHRRPRRLSWRRRIRRHAKLLWMTAAVVAVIVMGGLALRNGFETTSSSTVPPPHWGDDRVERKVEVAWDVLQMALPAEATEFAQQVQDLQLAVAGWQASLEQTTFATSPETPWRDQLNSIQQELESLAGESSSPVEYSPFSGAE